MKVIQNENILYCRKLFNYIFDSLQFVIKETWVTYFKIELKYKKKIEIIYIWATKIPLHHCLLVEIPKHWQFFLLISTFKVQNHLGNIFHLCQNSTRYHPFLVMADSFEPKTARHLEYQLLVDQVHPRKEIPGTLTYFRSWLYVTCLSRVLNKLL